jgi:hypothetical protein
MSRKIIALNARCLLPVLALGLLASCGGSDGDGSSAPQNPSMQTPGVTISAAPASISNGGSSTLTWSATNATACTASGSAQFNGSVAVSGSVSVTPMATTTFALNCSGSGGNANAATTVTVSPFAPSGGASAFSNPDDGNIPDKAKHPIAFPTAIGFGRVASVRSSDAVVYKINSLEDVASPGDGKITYRECALALAVTSPYNIPAGRPRYCVFDVAGAIQLESPAWITVPKIYIAGQTSPGGIEFRLGANYNPVDSLIDTRRGGNDMILRHVRTRLGEHPTRSSDNGDSIRLNGTDRQIIDHVSTMFGTDESIEMDCTNCTIQWSIIGPNICRNAGHSSALHCKTFFLKPAGNVTIAYNLSQHGEQRGINIAPGTAPATAGTAMQADIFNNVLYHFVMETGLISNQFGSAYANYMGNVALRGPRYNPSDGNYLAALYGEATSLPFGFKLYMKDNVTPRTRIAGMFGQTVTDPHNAAAGFYTGVTPASICGLGATGAQNCSISGLSVVQNSSYALAPATDGLQWEPWQVGTPEQAMRDVLAFSGADLCRDGSCRDNVDNQYIDDVRTCDTPPYLFVTSWASTVAQAGGYANLTVAAAKTDSDNDGMPDEWERRFRNTNPDVWDANADTDGDGYPNIEEYLNSLAKDDLRYSGFIGSGTGSLPAYNCGRPMF